MRAGVRGKHDRSPQIYDQALPCNFSAASISCNINPHQIRDIHIVVIYACGKDMVFNLFFISGLVRHEGNVLAVNAGIEYDALLYC